MLSMSRLRLLLQLKGVQQVPEASMKIIDFLKFLLDEWILEIYLFKIRRGRSHQVAGWSVTCFRQSRWFHQFSKSGSSCSHLGRVQSWLRLALYTFGLQGSHSGREVSSWKLSLSCASLPLECHRWLGGSWDRRCVPDYLAFCLYPCHRDDSL